jgi:hypothetical protein
LPSSRHQQQAHQTNHRDQVNQHHPRHPLDDPGLCCLDLALELGASFGKLSPYCGANAGSELIVFRPDSGFELGDLVPKSGSESGDFGSNLGPELRDLRLERALPSSARRSDLVASPSVISSFEASAICA